MDLIVMYVTESSQVVDRIVSAITVVLNVVKLKHFPWIVSSGDPTMPPTSHVSASMPISFQNGHSDRIRYGTIMLIRLPILFEEIYADG